MMVILVKMIKRIPARDCHVADVIATHKTMKRHAYVIRIGGKWDLRPVQTVIL